MRYTLPEHTPHSPNMLAFIKWLWTDDPAVRVSMHTHTDTHTQTHIRHTTNTHTYPLAHSLNSHARLTHTGATGHQ